MTLSKTTIENLTEQEALELIEKIAESHNIGIYAKTPTGMQRSLLYSLGLFNIDTQRQVLTMTPEVKDELDALCPLLTEDGTLAEAAVEVRDRLFFGMDDGEVVDEEDFFLVDKRVEVIYEFNGQEHKLVKDDFHKQENVYMHLPFEAAIKAVSIS